MDGSRERDQSVERLLRQSLQTPRHAGVTDSCLDAETLATWVDRGLSGAELELAQSHIADCTRCQTIVGTLARINSGVPQAKPERAPRRWLAWLVPLTAAAAAVALWAIVPRHTGAPFPQATEVQKSADASKPEQAASLDDRLQNSEGRDKDTGRREKEQSSQARARSQNERRPPTAVSGKLAKNDELVRNQPPVEAVELRSDANRLEADSLKRQPSASPATAPSGSVAPSPAAPAAAASASSVSESLTARQAPAAQRLAKAAPFEIVSPDPAVRWRIAGSVLQRSTNGGSSWDAVSTGIVAELTAGAAPSASVCWIVGRGGVVLLSTNGRSWRRLAFPEAVDLSMVQAADALTASVTTADGRIFATTDGGATWVRR